LAASTTGQYLSTIADLCALASVTFEPEQDEALTRFHEVRRSDFVAGLMFGAANNLRVVRIRLASPLEALLVAISPPATILAASRIITTVRDWSGERSIGRDRARLVTALVDQAVHDLNANESGVIADVLSNGLLERLMVLPPNRHCRD
jgi:hypothetical protein